MSEPVRYEHRLRSVIQARRSGLSSEALSVDELDALLGVVAAVRARQECETDPLDRNAKSVRCWRCAGVEQEALARLDALEGK